MKHYYCLICTLIFSSLAFAEIKKPNFIIIFTDDQGYGDLVPFPVSEFRSFHIF